MKKMNELGLDKNTLVGQGFDGAAYMSSEAALNLFSVKIHAQ